MSPTVFRPSFSKQRMEAVFVLESQSTDVTFQTGNVKGLFPFQTGTTSYIVPADMLTNVRALADGVDNVELLLFESDAIAPLPEPAVVDKLKNLAETKALSYTVHLPLDLHLGSTDESERRASVGKCARAIARMAPMAPFAYLLHLNGRPSPLDADAQTVTQWKDNMSHSITDILEVGVPASSLCVETVFPGFDELGGCIRRHGLSVCLDIGHIILARRSPMAYLDVWLNHVRVVHVHGVHEGKDHADLSKLDDGLLADLVTRLRRTPPGSQVVTIEVFNAADLERSIATIRGLAR